MKCIIIYNQPSEGAGADEMDVLDQVELFSRGLGKLGIEFTREGIGVDFMAQFGKIASTKPDFIVNLVESIDNHGELAFFIPALLGLHRIPYTGCPVDAIFITGNKRIASKTMERSGIPVPGSFPPSQSMRLDPSKRYIIKPVWEDGSLGITAESVFYGKEAGDVINEMHDDAHWTVEEFVDGREFNISIIDGDDGPTVLPPAEIVFRNFGTTRPRIVDFSAKWDTSSFEYKNTIREFPEDLDKVTLEAIRKCATDCWNTFGLRGYARVDMRLDSDKRPKILEVNANPCISPDSGFIAACNKAGMDETEVVARIIKHLN